MDSLIQLLPPELAGFVLTLVLSLLIGFEREEHEPEGIGGVRTFPIIGLSGFLLVEAFPTSMLPFGLGLVVLGLLVALSHWAGVRQGEPGITTEAAALLTFTLGGAVATGLYWLSIATGVVAVILLQEKTRLEGLATRFPREDLRTLVRFLLITGVVLPALPNHPFTEFAINPFKIWLIVVAVSGVSYLSYLLQLKWDAREGVLLAGVLGGAYSSTVTTVALARQSKRGHPSPSSYAGAIVAATGIMYFRLWILVALFASALAQRLAVLFWGLGFLAVILGVLLNRRGIDPTEKEQEDSAPEPRRVGNPLELSSALTFAAIFIAVLVITHFVADNFGSTGVLVMAGIMGATDVDPLILGLTQYADHGLSLSTAALAIVIAAAANNLMKGIYAFAFGSRPAGRIALGILTAFGVASIALYAAL
jgi:uncharacterized membrane protein (DUF4010 family)